MSVTVQQGLQKIPYRKYNYTPDTNTMSSPILRVPKFIKSKKVDTTLFSVTLKD